jgi:hypothetical protein
MEGSSYQQQSWSGSPTWPRLTVPFDFTFAGVPIEGHQAGREAPASLQHPHRHPKGCRELQEVGELSFPT